MIFSRHAAVGGYLYDTFQRRILLLGRFPDACQTVTARAIFATGAMILTAVGSFYCYYCR